MLDLKYFRNLVSKFLLRNHMHSACLLELRDAHNAFLVIDTEWKPNLCLFIKYKLGVFILINTRDHHPSWNGLMMSWNSRGSIWIKIICCDLRHNTLEYKESKIHKKKKSHNASLIADNILAAWEYSHVRCPDKVLAACVHTETRRTAAVKGRNVQLGCELNLWNY